MTAPDIPESPSGGTLLGDALRALVRLRPANDETAAAILELLQLRARGSAGSTAPARPAPVDAVEEEPDGPGARDASPFRLVSDAHALPPIVASEIEEIGETGAPPPSWLGNAPPIALPTTIANPFRRHSRPLFEPKWQRAIVTRLASVTLPVGELDIDRVVEHISCGRPLAEAPRRPVSTAAKGLRLLIDQGESMEPYRLDVAELARNFRRTIGGARVSSHAFRGLPEWGCGTGLDWIEYRAPPSGVPVVVVSDLGLAPRDRASAHATTSEWSAFFQRLERSTHRCTAIVPRDVRDLRGALRRHARLVPWGRRTLASRLDQPRTGADGAAAASGANVVALGKVGEVHPHALELGVLGSLAARIEPQLLRSLRLELAPHLPVSAEAELWFSELVGDRAATGIVLEPQQRETLQRLLRRDREQLDRAYALIDEMHRDAATALRVEEELAYRWLTGDLAAARRLLRSLVATLITPERTGVSKWAAQALVRLPRGLMSLEEAQMLALGTALRTGETAQLQSASGAGSSWHWLRPPMRELELGVNLRRGLIEFGPRSMRAAHWIRVPDSNPVTLEVVAKQPAGRVERVRLNPLARTVVEVAGDAFEINVLGGARWQLREARSSRSAQRFVARSRAPRVQIEYEVELYGAEKKVHLPFVLGVMSDLSGAPAEPLAPVADRKFREIDVDNFDAHMKGNRPRVAFEVPNAITGEGSIAVDITFGRMDDFGPEAVARRVPPLSQLLDARQQLAMLVTYMDGKAGAEELIAKVMDDPNLLQALASGKDTGESTPPGSSWRAAFGDVDPGTLLERELRPGTDDARRSVQAALRTLAREALARPGPRGSDVPGSIGTMIAEIDRKLSAQVNLILHHEDFQRLEGAWRGLHYLVSNTETDELLKIRYMNMSKPDLTRTLGRLTGTEFEQSPIFRAIFEEQIALFGGEPYGCLVGDYYFDHSPADVQTLREIGRIAAAAHCPFIAGASPLLLMLDSWQELANPRDVTKIFTTVEYAAWRSLRESEDARYLGLAAPRFLARLPYGAATQPVEAFAFEEVSAGEHGNYTWANSAYAMAVNIGRAFKLYGWCARIRGVESGGAVEGLPVHTFPTDDGGVDMKCPTEIAITDRREAELARNGLMPLVHRPNSDLAAFFNAQSLQRPAQSADPDTTANATLYARLPYLFACCRFTHYVQCIARDRIGSFMDREALERRLQNWLTQYVDSDPEHSSESNKARFPLAAAEIKIEEAESDPHRYVANLYLQPHFQLEGLTAPLRLVAYLPRAG